jgi:hypothetical protein
MTTPDNYLAELPLPEPPAGLAEAIQARIEQIESDDRGRSTTRDWSVWVMAAGGLSAVLALVVSMAFGDRAPIDVAAIGPRRGNAGFGAMPTEATGAVAFAAGLVSYALGLFATTRKTGRESEPSQNNT